MWENTPPVEELKLMALSAGLRNSMCYSNLWPNGYQYALAPLHTSDLRMLLLLPY